MYRITRNHEDVQTATTEIIEDLEADDLRHLQERASLHTWLVTVARNKAIDVQRRRLGRKKVPAAIRDLGPAHAELFRLYYLEAMPYGEVRTALVQAGLVDGAVALADLMGEILDVIDPRTLHRASWDRPAAAAGLGSGRLLELHDELRRQAEDRGMTLGLEYREHEDRVRRTLAALKAFRAELPADERRILEMRFDRGMTAREIARDLGIEDARQVYTMVDRSLRTLRKLLTAAGFSVPVVILAICARVFAGWSVL